MDGIHSTVLGSPPVQSRRARGKEPEWACVRPGRKDRHDLADAKLTLFQAESPADRAMGNSTFGSDQSRGGSPSRSGLRERQADNQKARACAAPLSSNKMRS